MSSATISCLLAGRVEDVNERRWMGFHLRSSTNDDEAMPRFPGSSYRLRSRGTVSAMIAIGLAGPLRVMNKSILPRDAFE